MVYVYVRVFKSIYLQGWNFPWHGLQISCKDKATHIRTYTEMEFLDISLTKDLSLLLHAIHSPLYYTGRF